jgi:hypothetical protein
MNSNVPDKELATELPHHHGCVSLISGKGAQSGGRQLKYRAPAVVVQHIVATDARVFEAKDHAVSGKKKIVLNIRRAVATFLRPGRATAGSTAPRLFSGLERSAPASIFRGVATGVLRGVPGGTELLSL